MLETVDQRSLSYLAPFPVLGCLWLFHLIELRKSKINIIKDHILSKYKAADQFSNKQLQKELQKIHPQSKISLATVNAAIGELVYLKEIVATTQKNSEFTFRIADPSVAVNRETE